MVEISSDDEDGEGNTTPDGNDSINESKIGKRVNERDEAGG